MTNICVIPARAGSRRIPLKNVKLFHGKPIISYSIKAAQDSGRFSLVVVSTDSKDIADVALEYGACPVWRGDAMSQDEIGTQQVMKFVLNQLSLKFEFACCVYATAPMLSYLDIRSAYDILINEENTDYVFSVGTDPLQDAAQFYWGRSEAFLRERNLIGERTRIYPIPKNRVIDINTELDWSIAGQMFADLYK